MFIPAVAGVFVATVVVVFATVMLLLWLVSILGRGYNGQGGTYLHSPSSVPHFPGSLNPSPLLVMGIRSRLRRFRGIRDAGGLANASDMVVAMGWVHGWVCWRVFIGDVAAGSCLLSYSARAMRGGEG